MKADFECAACGNVVERETGTEDNCTCGNPLKRVWTPFAIKAPFSEHFNYTTGQYVRNMSDFKSQLSYASEHASMSKIDPVTGNETYIEHNYVPIDPRDYTPPNVEETKDATAKTLREKGITDATKKIIV